MSAEQNMVLYITENVGAQTHPPAVVGRLVAHTDEKTAVLYVTENVT